MDGEDDSFALPLSHEYRENSIRNFGEAIVFFIVQLRWKGVDNSGNERHADSITWYTVGGDELGVVTNVNAKFKILNPYRETLQQLWGKFKETEESYIRHIGYTRHAIVAWQTVKHPEKAMKLIPPDAAAAVLMHSSVAVDGPLVRQLLEAAENRMVCDSEVSGYDDRGCIKLSTRFYEGNETLIPSLSRIVRVFDWSEIGEVVLASLSKVSNVVKLVKWLEEEMKTLDTKFTWKMPGACVLRSSEATTKGKTVLIVKIQAFLREAERFMTTKGRESFNGLQDAQNFADKCLCEERNCCSFKMEAIEDDEKAFVTIKKTSGWSLAQQKKLMQYSTELRLLKEKFEEDLEVNTGNKKRTRLIE
ncbi:hypothetical protein V7S43_002052 [Phytophthora oleae]|uniref:Uncharacterized protein n=1 Tax=Phytophthora oleae TaxID=2107226 RepID=A0ABD3G429_9STRA